MEYYNAVKIPVSHTGDREYKTPHPLNPIFQVVAMKVRKKSFIVILKELKDF